MATRGQIISELEMAFLFAYANGKPLANYPGEPAYDYTMPWASELSRLRGVLFNYLRADAAIEVSGPWPLKDLSTTFGSRSAGAVWRTLSASNAVDFYFAASQSEAANVTVSVFQQTPGFETLDPDWINNPNFSNGVSSIRVEVIIGGTQSCRLQGQFWFRAYPTGPGGISGSVNTDMSGVNFTMPDPPISPLIIQSIFSNRFDITVSPGTYFFEANISNAFFDRPAMFGSSDNTPGTELKLTAPPFTNAVPAFGIHDSLPIWKISASQDNEVGYPFGVWGLGYLNSQGLWNTTGNNYQASVAGLWAGKSAPISGIANATGYMPWNTLNVRGEPDINVTTSEKQRVPYMTNEISWSNVQAVTAGQYIRAAGVYQIATNTGLTGTSQPLFWGTTHGALTQDNQITWEASEALWATARYVSMPIYPFKKTGQITTPESLPGWNAFFTGWKNPNSLIYNSYWWLRRIRLNRIRSGPQDDYTNYQGEEIPVQIGCLRNGVFVPFGTWNTGDWVRVQSGVDENDEPIMTDHLLWPIFTKNPLVYQADEIVDVQADIIPGVVGIGPGVSFPPLADYYNDTVALLNLI